MLKFKRKFRRQRVNIILRGTAITADLLSCRFLTVPPFTDVDAERARVAYTYRLSSSGSSANVSFCSCHSLFHDRYLKQTAWRHQVQMSEGSGGCPQLTRFIDNRILFDIFNLFVYNGGWKYNWLSCIEKKPWTVAAEMNWPKLISIMFRWGFRVDF